jgi:hypothetical protein
MMYFSILILSIIAILILWTDAYLVCMLSNHFCEKFFNSLMKTLKELTNSFKIRV